jgi:hypothetical protein
MYGSDSFAVPSNLDALSGRETPKMLKALGQLTTPITALRFNHDAQILAMASKDKKDAFRLVCSYFALAFLFCFLFALNLLENDFHPSL